MGRRWGGEGDADLSPAVQRHVRALQDCNQRGGRMLSLIDLIRARTVNLPLAAYLAAVMRQGHSLLVGAQPGGAGKTTVMVALLNFLPDETVIRPIEGRVVLQAGLEDTDYGATCYLAHEIGDGYYYAYIWGEEARLFFDLAGRGHIVASNLHADTLEAARAQLCDENGVDPADLAAVTLKVFMRIDRGAGRRMRRRVSHVYESDGADGRVDRLVWTSDGSGRFVRQAESYVVTEDEERCCLQLLEALQQERKTTLTEIRQALVSAD